MSGAGEAEGTPGRTRAREKGKGRSRETAGTYSGTYSENISLGRRDSAEKQVEKVGPYRLEHRLGSGGMGAVWRARDERLRRAVALKRILPASADAPKLRERLRREARAVARLNHPAIVQVYDIIETQESDWIVMELVEGQTLQEILRQEGPLDAQRVLRLGRDIAEGLAEAHAQGFIHRDLKAPNVMVTPSGRAKILDFGIAKQIQPEAQETTLSTPGTLVGTSYAMSPEQAMGLPLDPRSDLFSLGSLLYEMVAGFAPFRADTVQATLARVCSLRQGSVASIRHDVPLGFSDLIDFLLQKEPAHRPRSAAEVATALDQIAVEQATFPAEARASYKEREAAGQETVVEIPRRQAEELPFLGSSAEHLRTTSIFLLAEPDRPQEDVGTPVLPLTRRMELLVRIALLLLVVLGASNGAPASNMENMRAQVVALSALATQSASHDPYQQGVAYLDRFDKDGSLGRAIQLFEQAVAQDKDHAAAHAALASAYWLKFQADDRNEVKWLDKALPFAERAVSLDPNLAAARVSLGQVLGSIGRLDEALRHIERALILEPDNGDAYFAAGRIHASQRNFAEAESAFKKATVLRPHKMTFNGLGSFYFGRNRAEDAIIALRKSIELAPDNTYAYDMLGYIYLGRGDFAEAAAQYQKSIHIRPDLVSYANLGSTYFYQGRYQQAAEVYEKAVKLPESAQNDFIWSNLGQACRWVPNKSGRSREAYQRAIKIVKDELLLEPEDVRRRARLAMYLALRGDRAESLAELRKLQNLDGKDESDWHAEAVAYEVTGQRVQALTAIENAVRGGFRDRDLKDDPDLRELRADPRYRQFIAELAKEQAQRYDRLNRAFLN